MPILFTSNSNRNILASGKKRGILFDSVYLPHKAVRSSRKIESTHRWNLLDNCYFAHIHFLLPYLHAGHRKEKRLHNWSYYTGVTAADFQPWQETLSHHFFFIQLHAAQAFCERIQPASECCSGAFIRWSTWLLSQGWTMIEQLSEFSRNNSTPARGAWKGWTPLLSNHKETLLLKWWVSIPGSLFFQLDTGCHFGSAESKIKFQTFSSRLAEFELSVDIFITLPVEALLHTVFLFLTVERHLCSSMWIGKTERVPMDNSGLKKSQDLIRNEVLSITDYTCWSRFVCR